MERHQGICQTCLTGYDGCLTRGDVDGHGRLASGDCYGDDQLLLFDHVPYESDLAGNISFFKSRLKPIDERPSRKRRQVLGKGQRRYDACGGSF